MPRGFSCSPYVIPPPPAAASVVDSNLAAANEGDGVSPFTTGIGIGTAGVTLLAWAGMVTSQFGTLSGNNSNSYTEEFNQSYIPFPGYSIRGFRSYGVAGGSNHSVQATKTASPTQEDVIALLALSGGTIVSQNTGNVANAGAGHTFTTGSVTTTKAALLVGVASGDGNVSATAPTQTWGSGWTVRRFVARSSAEAPAGHIPLYVCTKPVAGAGSYTADITVTIDEGLVWGLWAVQLP